MFSNNPNRLASKVAAAANTAAGALQTQQDLEKALKQALNRISELERQISTLLGVLYVDNNGNVELSSAGRISLIAGADMTLRSDISVKAQTVGGASVDLTTSQATISAPSKVHCETSVLEASAAMVDISAGMTQTSGTLKCDTIIANSVVGSSYTPGAGNVW